jgi:hypothetical protein
MFQRPCKTLFIWATLYAAALPACAQSPAPGPNEWTPANWIALITAIGSIIVAVIGAMKGTAAQKAADSNAGRLAGHEQQISSAAQTAAAAQSKADANEQRLNAVGNRLNAHGQQITDLAKNMLPPAMQPQVEPAGPPKD